MRSRVTDRGQVTIPKSLREQYGLREGVEVEFVPEKGGLRVRKAGAAVHPVDRVYGVLGRESSSDEYIEEIRGR